MKANYKRNKDGVIVPSKVVLTTEQIEEALNIEWEKKKEQVYAEIKADVANQVLAVMFTALKVEFGFGKKRLLKVKEATEMQFKLMQEGVFWSEYTPEHCLKYLKDNFGIDLDKDGSVRKCYEETSPTK